MSAHSPIITVDENAIDPGEGEVEIGEDADRRGLDDVMAEAMEIAGPSAAGIDAGGDAAAPRHLGRIDAERGSAPIDMGVQIDQPRRHDEARDVAHLGSRPRREIGADRGDAAVREGNVGDLVDPLARIDDAAAFEQ